MVDHDARISMSRHVKRLAKLGHILCFQEVHGSLGDVLLSFREWLPDWKIFGSPSVNPDGTFNHSSGGLVIAICPNIASVANLKNTLLSLGGLWGSLFWLGIKF